MLAATGGAAITLTPLIASRLIPHLGWRRTWLLIAVVVIAVHLLSLAASKSPVHATATAHNNPIGAGNLSTRVTAGLDRRRRSAFAVVAGGYATVAATATALGFHQIAILQERGLTASAAAAAVSASEGTLLTRWLGTDQLGMIRGRLMATLVTASAIGPLAFTLLADATGSYTTAATMAAALPLAVGIGAALAPLPEHRPM